MSLETGTYINDLTPSNPLSSDPAGQGDDHLRLIKATVQNTLPNMGAVLGTIHRQSSGLSILSTWNTNRFIADGSATATVTMVLPATASITSGFYVLFTALSNVDIVLQGSGGISINGAATFTIPRTNDGIAYYQAGIGWYASRYPNGNGSSVYGGDNLYVAGTATLSGTVVLSNGQLQFPATQNPSSNANTLDDYEEGTWTPTFTFATPGNLSTTYSARTGTYTKIGNTVTAICAINLSVYAQTTASGALQITGLPFTSGATQEVSGVVGSFVGTGTTFAGINTQMIAHVLASTAAIEFATDNWTAGSVSVVQAAHIPSGGVPLIRVAITYQV